MTESGGLDMEAQDQELYSELRKMRKELQESLYNGKCSNLIRPIIEDELKDIEETIERMEAGKFGLCEISGELIPDELLIMVPTLKSLDDVDKISKYFCKPIYN
jgi:RNA polymerase-binding transcription factor DksA